MKKQVEKEEAVEQIEPPKVQKKLPTRVWISYIIMTAAVAAIAAFAIAFMMGYRFSLSGEIERTGLVQIASSPTGSTISIDGNQIDTKTNAKLVLSEGEHWIEVGRNGFDTWKGSFVVKMNDILWLDYVLLFPLELKPKAVENFKLTPLQIISPNRLLAESEDKALYTVDFSRNDYRVQRLDFTWEDLQKQLLEGITIQKVIATDNDNNLWLEGNNNTIFMYSINNKRLTPIASDKKIVASAFYYRDLVFVAENDDKKFDVYFYQTGDTSPALWKTFDEMPSVLFSSYKNVNYLALSLDSKTDLYSNQRDRFNKNNELILTIEDSRDLSFSPNGRFLHVGQRNYDLESGVFYDDIWMKHWFNGNLMSKIEDGKFFVNDFDGWNWRELAIEPANLDYVFISNNSKKLYYFDKDNRLILVDLEAN